MHNVKTSISISMYQSRATRWEAPWKPSGWLKPPCGSLAHDIIMMLMTLMLPIDMQATDRTIMNSLPTRKQAIIAVATAKVGHRIILFFHFLVISLNLKVLGHFAIDEVYLPNITSSHFGEEDAKKVYLDFREELLKVVSIIRRQYFLQQYTMCLIFWSCNLVLFQAEKTIQERNDKLTAEGKIPYTVLLPSKIPAGIAVWLDVLPKISGISIVFTTFKEPHR